MRSMTVLATAAGLLAAGAAGAQTGSTVTLTFDGVHSSEGMVEVALCGDPKATLPGGCFSYSGAAKASTGRTVVVIPGVAPGVYAIQAFHDENGDNRPEIPPEGYAFGNDAPFPPSFEAASIKVAGDVQAHMTMTYIGGAPAAPAAGTKGVEPPAGLTRTDVRAGGLYAELYEPEGGSSLPAIIAFGGSEGGLDTISGMAVSFAQKGYAVLALAYWAEPGLPKTLELVPLEYFDRAVAWLKARPEVDPKAIGAIGWSRGSEAVLLLGSRNPDVHAVAAIAPSGHVWQGLNYQDTAHAKPAWTVGGEPLPYLTPDSSAYRSNAPLKAVFISALAGADRRPETQIPVEKVNGPILLISGGDDALWPSEQMADEIVARLQAKGFRHGVQHLTYAKAGHAVFVGAPDGVMARGFAMPVPMLGGSPEANAQAWADDWPRTLAFFHKALKGDAQ
jgi:dienelactone hydrolase/uncharacterized protein (DUF2141 family)